MKWTVLEIALGLLAAALAIIALYQREETKFHKKDADEQFKKRMDLIDRYNRTRRRLDAIMRAATQRTDR